MASNQRLCDKKIYIKCSTFINRVKSISIEHSAVRQSVSYPPSVLKSLDFISDNHYHYIGFIKSVKLMFKK